MSLSLENLSHNVYFREQNQREARRSHGVMGALQQRTYRIDAAGRWFSGVCASTCVFERSHNSTIVTPHKILGCRTRHSFIAKKNKVRRFWHVAGKSNSSQFYIAKKNKVEVSAFLARRWEAHAENHRDVVPRPTKVCPFGPVGSRSQPKRRSWEQLPAGWAAAVQTRRREPAAALHRCQRRLVRNRSKRLPEARQSPSSPRKRLTIARP